jgi:hypothetical protein
VGKSVPEAPGSVLERTEPDFDDRPISPRFTPVLAVEEFERPVVPRAAVARWYGPTAALTIDCRPDGVLFTVDLGLRLVDGDLLTSPAVGLGEMFQSVEPLSDRVVRPIDERFDPAVREASVIQKRCEDTPFCRRALTREYFLLACFPDVRSSVLWTPDRLLDRVSFTLSSTPLLLYNHNIKK